MLLLLHPKQNQNKKQNDCSFATSGDCKGGFEASRRTRKGLASPFRSRLLRSFHRGRENQENAW
jgi:hypothetical protein